MCPCICACPVCWELLLDSQIKYGSCFIIVYRSGAMIHTVMARGSGIKKGIYVYNFFSASSDEDKHVSYFPSISAMMKYGNKKSIIAGYLIYK